jgi:hypothetical protein
MASQRECWKPCTRRISIPRKWRIDVTRPVCCDVIATTSQPPRNHIVRTQPPPHRPSRH